MFLARCSRAVPADAEARLRMSVPKKQKLSELLENRAALFQARAQAQEADRRVKAQVSDAQAAFDALYADYNASKERLNTMRGTTEKPTVTKEKVRAVLQTAPRRPAPPPLPCPPPPFSAKTLTPARPPPPPLLPLPLSPPARPGG